MGNSKGKAAVNKDNFIAYMEEAKDTGRLFIDGENYTLINKDGQLEATMNIATGQYVGSKAGQNKSNKRCYLKVNNWMCPNYTFKVVADGLFSQDFDVITRFYHYKDNDSVDINHINGNTLDNTSGNLEVTSKGLNNAHARFMAEAAVYYPDLFDIELDCQNNKMHSWRDGIGVSCEQIKDWNDTHEIQIKAFKDPKGEWNSHLDKGDVKKMLEYFGKAV